MKIDLAGEIWQVDVPATWTRHFQDVFGHLEYFGADEAIVSIRVRDSASPELAAWAAGLLQSSDAAGATAVLREADQITHVSRLAIERYRWRERSGELILLEPAARTELEGTNLLLRPMAFRAAQRGLIPLHAAAFGTRQGVYIVPARGGMGKSTTTLVAFAAGLHVIGDDYVLWDPATDLVHSIYRTIRLNRDSLDMVRHHFPLLGLRTLTPEVGGKTLVAYQPDGGVANGVNSAPVRGIFLLTRNNAAGPGGAAPPARALQAFASTSCHLPYFQCDTAAAFRKFSSLVKRADVHEFGMSPDLRALASSLTHYFQGATWNDSGRQSIPQKERLP